MHRKQIQIGICTTLITGCSYFVIYHSSIESAVLPVIAFLLIIGLSLFLYQILFISASPPPAQIVLHVAGRLIFTAVIIYINWLLMMNYRKNEIRKHGIRTYAVAAEVSGKYRRGRRVFSRHFRYIVNGKVLKTERPYRKAITIGDTLYLTYSSIDPHIVIFDNDQ